MQKAVKFGALAFAAMMLASSLLVAAPARSTDTSNSFFEDLAPGAPYNGYTFNDVAWTPDGKAALFVGYSGTIGKAAWYYPDNNTWWEASTATNYASILNCVVWDLSGARFVTVGQATSSGYYFTVSAIGGRLQMMTSTTFMNCNVNDAVYRAWDTGVWFCGLKTGTGPFTARLQGASCVFGPIASGFTTGQWYGIAVQYTGYAMYLVGTTGTGNGLVHSYINGTLTLVGFSTTIPAVFSDVVLDESRSPSKLIMTTMTRSVAQLGVWTCTRSGWNLNTAITGYGSIPLANNLYAMCMDASGVSPGTTVMVGYNGSYGFVYDCWTDSGGTFRVALRSTANALFAAKQFKGVATRPTGQPFALVSGSAFKYSYTSAPSNVQVDTVYPHIAYVELYNAGTVTSKLNTQLDVDSGNGDIEYDLVVKAWSNAGQANIVQVDAFLWYDGGSNETFPWWGASGFTSPGYENIRMNFRWLRGGNVFSMQYPGSGETTFNVSGCSAVDSGDLKNVTVTFRFCPRQQVRFADGPFGPEGPGNRYSFAPEGQTVAALNNLDSWNIRATVWDIGASQSSGYDEFGTYRYTYIGGAGLPGGGSMYGAGPPNSWVFLSPNDEDVTFSSNCAYQLQVKVTDLLGVAIGNTIPATALGVMGGTLGAYEQFPATNAPVALIGTIAPNPVTYQPPQETGTTTTTSSADFDLGIEPVMMRCWINTVAEDRYLGVLTYSVVHP